MFSQQHRKAPEIVSTEGQWINSKALALKEMRGKIVLLDFWAYSCINCLRTLPALKQMWKKYRDRNVAIIGVHTPEFEFEKDIANVRFAVKKYGIEYPVLNDPERINWELYGNTYWPRAELINAKGELIFEHIGESGYDEIDRRIIEELKEKGSPIKEEKRLYPSEMSPEIYAGSLRNTGIGSRMVCTKEGCEYFDPGHHLENVIYLSGKWRQEPEYLEFENRAGYISIKYYASEVNVVMDGQGAAKVLLDKKPLTKENAGQDVLFRNGESYVNIDRAGMYNIVKSDAFGTGELSIIPFRHLRVYAYTFG